MTKDELFAKVQDIFRDVFDDDELVLTRETDADDIEDWDSLMQIRLVVAMEKQFRIKIPAQELQKLANVGEMVDFIEAKLQAAGK
ncbi:acyl carrier protein [uncultured Selenomonas sp.]|uniref:acyl carrier protein n=1 Tax=uncultured Selenomonas sp. TaxID=159275 RepID=UPI0025E7FC93|nr:acyl carrier protein [uncultured Selenomonas sp.]